MRTTSILIPIARWSARLAALILGAFLILFIVGEGFGGGGGAPPLYVLVPCLVVLAGFGLGWKYEGTGALLILVGFLSFNLMELRANGHLLRPGAFHLLLIPALLFLIAWSGRWLGQTPGDRPPIEGTIVQ